MPCAEKVTLHNSGSEATYYAMRLARMALRLPKLVARLSETHGVDLRIRIGIARGPMMAGVISANKFS